MQGLGNNDLIITLQPPPNLQKQDSGTTEEEKEEDRERQEEEDQQEEEEEEGFAIAFVMLNTGMERKLTGRSMHNKSQNIDVQLWPSLWMQVTLHCAGIVTKHCRLTACISGSSLCYKLTTCIKALTGSVHQCVIQMKA